MSAFTFKADMCGATRHVRFGPIADIEPTSDEHSNARQDNRDLGELARLHIIEAQRTAPCSNPRAGSTVS